MKLLILILNIIILGFVVYLIILQRKSRKLQKIIDENWKKINEGRKKINKIVKKAEETFGYTKKL